MVYHISAHTHAHNSWWLFHVNQGRIELWTYQSVLWSGCPAWFFCRRTANTEASVTIPCIFGELHPKDWNHRRFGKTKTHQNTRAIQTTTFFSVYKLMCLKSEEPQKFDDSRRMEMLSASQVLNASHTRRVQHQLWGITAGVSSFMPCHSGASGLTLSQFLAFWGAKYPNIIQYQHVRRDSYGDEIAK